MYSIVASLVLLLSASLGFAAEDCTHCHQVDLRGAHAEFACTACHGEHAGRRTAEQLRRSTTALCESCHAGTGGVLHGPMAEREAEKAFVDRTWGREDPNFFETNCNQCHVQDCLDCHGRDGHSIAMPQKDDCHSCHRSYYVGADYYGMAPREDALRYQRGPSYGGEHYLKMAPDVHAEAGLTCGDCHTMGSLANAEVAPKTCRECHEPDTQVIEHGIAAHMEKLECYACHAGWAPQEYGTFFIRLRESSVGEYFRVRRDTSGPGYVKSAYLRRQDAPPLGINEHGRVSPIRPQFLAYFTDIHKDEPVGEENRLLGAEWKAFFPHTIQRGAVMCDGCHSNPARFLLEKEEDRIYDLDRDGLTLSSFWARDGQKIINGAFFDRARFERMTQKSPAYTKAYVKKWKTLVDGVEASSKP